MTTAQDRLSDAVKQLITLSSAALTLSVVFVHDIGGGSVGHWERIDMRASWALMLVSIIAGLGALFTIVNNVAISNATLKGLTLVQQAAFVLSFGGIVAVAWGAIK